MKTEPARRAADASLAAALIAGDPGAPVRAWKGLSPLVRRFLARFFGGWRADDRDDLCQEVFLRFFLRIGELRDPRSLRAFLIGICLGVAKNERRRARVRRRVFLAPTGVAPELSVRGPDIEACEVLVRLHRILDGMDAADRALFVVRHVDKAGMADIAAAGGWPIHTAKRRVARATRRAGIRMRRDPALAEYAERLSRGRGGLSTDGTTARARSGDCA